MRNLGNKCMMCGELNSCHSSQLLKSHQNMYKEYKKQKKEIEKLHKYIKKVRKGF